MGESVSVASALEMEIPGACTGGCMKEVNRIASAVKRATMFGTRREV